MMHSWAYPVGLLRGSVFCTKSCLGAAMGFLQLVGGSRRFDIESCYTATMAFLWLKGCCICLCTYSSCREIMGFT